MTLSSFHEDEDCCFYVFIFLVNDRSEGKQMMAQSSVLMQLVCCLLYLLIILPFILSGLIKFIFSSILLRAQTNTLKNGYIINFSYIMLKIFFVGFIPSISLDKFFPFFCILDFKIYIP